MPVLDLDTRQQSTAHFFANRARLDDGGSGVALPLARRPGDVADSAGAGPGAGDTEADFTVIDTPGADTELSRAAHQRADLIVTPMNDSFVDFDMLGVVDPVTLELRAAQPLRRDGLGGAQAAGGGAGAAPSTGSCCAIAWPRSSRATAAAWTSG